MVRTLNATDGGDLAEVFGTVSGIEAIRQQVTQRLRFVAGEWIVNVEEGVPYFGEVLSLRTENSDLLDDLVIAEVLSVEFVERVEITRRQTDPKTRRYRMHTQVGVADIILEVPGG